jgi:DNA-binding NarL/FixJ family response regulator
MRTLVVSRLAAPMDPLNPQPGAGVTAARVNDDGALSVLTTREMEILKLIGLGLSSADIAKRLGRSVKTVEWHRVSLGDKLNVTNRVELARIAIAAGLVGVSDVRKPAATAAATDAPVTVA